MARLLVQATLPHSKPSGLVHRRTNGGLTIEMVGHPEYGLPYGTYPRLLLAWLTAEAVRTKSPVLYLGDTLASFLAQLALWRSGGPRVLAEAMAARIYIVLTCAPSQFPSE